jgi:serine phosphatase RsbU (regulator of sigma subunit)
MSDAGADILLLTVEQSAGEAFERRLEGKSFTIGRSSRADLVLADAMLSREHARIYREGDAWNIMDLKSRNGTRLNGESVTGPRRIGHQDVVTLGGCTLTVAAGPGEVLTPSSSSGAMRGVSLLRPASDILKENALHMKALASADQIQLRRFAERLQALIEINQALARIVALDELLELILNRAFRLLKPEEGAVFLTRQDGSVYRAVGRPVAAEGQALFASKTLSEEVVAKGQAALVQDAQVDERFSASDSVAESGVHSLIAAPFLDPDGSALGMIALCSRSTARQFQEDDLDLLTSLASVAALRIRNVALAEEAVVRHRLDDEIALARAIQVALYPKSIPQPPGYEIVAFNLPSRTVSGDLFQVLTRKEGQEFVLFVADVSGKGIGAALLTASLEALCAAPIEAGRSPEQVFSRASTLLHRRTSPEKYATALLAVLRPQSGKIRYANAGHNPGLLVREGGSLQSLQATGVPLGMFPKAGYRCESLSLNFGDTLVLFTDGIVEARNPEGEEYGSERLERVVVEHRKDSARDLAKAIEEDLDAFIKGVPFADDRTMVILRRCLPDESHSGG